MNATEPFANGELEILIEVVGHFTPSLYSIRTRNAVEELTLFGTKQAGIIT